MATVYVVAESPDEAAEFVVRYPNGRWSRIGLNTLPSKRAALVYRDDIRRSNPGRQFEVYPVELTAVVGEAIG